MVQSHSPRGANVPFHEGTLAPPGDAIEIILRPTRVQNPNAKSIGSAAFAQLTAESP